MTFQIPLPGLSKINTACLHRSVPLNTNTKNPGHKKIPEHLFKGFFTIKY